MSGSQKLLVVFDSSPNSLAWLSKRCKLSMACYILFSDRLTDYNFLGKWIRLLASYHTLEKFSAPGKFNKT